MKYLVGLGLAAIVSSAGARTDKPITHEIEVVGSDYAFALPREVPAGLTTFHFRNSGKVYHEMVLFVLKPGVTIEQFVRTAAEQKPVISLTEAPVGILFGAPGQRSSTALTTELVAGRQYLIWCGFRDTATAPRHIAMGMYSPLTVKPSSAEPIAKVKSDTVIAMDYAFKYPLTLSPGRHTIVFRNDGKVRHEVSIILPKKGATFEQMFAVRKARGNTRALNEDQLGVLFAAAGESPLGRLDVNLLPGREYRIICNFMNDSTSPPHYTLGMYGSIRVPRR